MRRALLAAILVAATACSSSTAPTQVRAESDPTVRILLGGDLSLGRGVGDIVAVDPDSVFAELRQVVRSPDLAMANLESPLTTRPHAVDNPNDLHADPASARLLAGAGFDVMGIANNHAGDAGPETVLDTLAALEDAGIVGVGGGADTAAANRPMQLDIGGVVVGVLAVDATGYGPPATTTGPGVAVWDDSVEVAVSSLRAESDVVIVGVHGGAEYLFQPDDAMRAIADQLAAWNVDVVWGHGAHVVQPVRLSDPDGDGRPTVVATSLGNLLFDQSLPGTADGAVLELLAGPGGIVATRFGATMIDSGRVAFDRWQVPDGDAVLLDGEWWALAPGAEPAFVKTSPGDMTGFSQGDVVAAAGGDVDGDGEDEVVVSFRRPFKPAALHDLFPDVTWQDATGRSAHVGVFAAGTLEPMWVASAVVRPVAELAVCDGAITVGYSTLDDATVIAAGGWTWSGFGWDEASDLDGLAAIGCRDVDGNGRLDPVVLRGGADGL